MERPYLKKAGCFTVALLAYTALAAYLLIPYHTQWQRWDYLMPINLIGGALGVLLLSRRWVRTWTASFISGLVYGFGPFAFYLMRFHPTAGSLIAGLPWLFCPAAFFQMRHRATSGFISRLRYFTGLIILVLLPGAALVLFHWGSTHAHWFALPVSLHGPDLSGWMGFLAPCVYAEQGDMLVGFYHLSLGPLVLGMAMLWRARRYTFALIAGLGLTLAYIPPILEVCPLMWLALPHIVGALAIGLGCEGLVWSGFADRMWLLIVGLLFGLLAAGSFALATAGLHAWIALEASTTQLLFETARAYVLGFITIGLLVCVTQAKLRLHGLKSLLLIAVLVVDIVLSARFVLDRIL
ncbi:hypothetical protein ACFL6U_13515 [Planctomycetota bacterium]